MILELNHCVEVRIVATQKSSVITSQLHLQEILRANASVKIAADLATKYRKNVQYNLAATTLHSDSEVP
jgi:DASH complex subunit DAD4